MPEGVGHGCSVLLRVVGLAVTAGLVGCSPGATAQDGSRPAPSPQLTAATPSPEGQRAALADGRASRAEYERAFEEFRQCVVAGGGRLRIVSRDMASGAISYQTGANIGSLASPNLDSVEGSCYHTYLGHVEMLFQTTDPAFLATMARQQRDLYATKARPCLVQHGESGVPLEIDPDSPEADRLLSRWMDLVSERKCEG